MNVQERNALILQWAPLVYGRVNKHLRRFKEQEHNREDLEQMCFEKLLLCSSSYDPARGAWSTFATYQLEPIFNYQARKLLGHSVQNHNEYTSTGRWHVGQTWHVPDIRSIDAPIKRDDPSGDTVVSQMEGKEVSPEVRARCNEVLRFLESRTPPADRGGQPHQAARNVEIYVRCVVYGEQFTDVARELHLSRERVRQIVKRSTEALREWQKAA